MKFRGKLFYAFIMIVLVTNGLFLIAGYRYGRDALLDESGSIALSVAATAASLIDGDQLQQVDKTTSEHAPLYNELEHKLRKVRDVNRRDDTHIRYVYSVYPDPKKPQILRYGVDAEEDGPDKSAPGSTVKFKSKNLHQTRYDIKGVVPGFIEDSWGTWLTANYPVYNKQGKAIGAIRADINAIDVIKKSNKLLFLGSLALITMLCLAAAIAWVLSRHFNAPLTKIRYTLAAIGQGNLEQNLEFKAKDEFTEIADVINQMLTGLRQRNTLRLSLTRYVSHELAERILSTDQLPQLSSERRKVTMLVCDIRNFTPLAESLKPEEVVNLLNEFFSPMIEAVTAHQGI
jgi:adenylate cyclase